MTDEERLDVLLNRWKQVLDQGRHLPPEVFCAEQGYPQLAPALKRAIQLEDEAAALQSSAVAVQTPPVGRTIEDMSSTMPQDPSGQFTLAMSEAERNTRVLVTQSQYKNIRAFEVGGQGILNVATDVDFQRDVVVKFMRNAEGAEHLSRSISRTEALITAQLQHPGVTPVYGWGETDTDGSFFAMRQIEGESLKESIKHFHAQPITLNQSAIDGPEFQRLLLHVISVCRTVAYAHNRGVVHRDLKPANVMLGKFGEAVVIDWGQAQTIERAPQLRASGELSIPYSSQSFSQSSNSKSGTPHYMSPEQAAACLTNLPPSNDALTAVGTDVFLLGGILYQLLTGNSPNQGSEIHEVLAYAMSGKVVPAHQVKRGIPRPLDAICMKALSPLIADRYAHADQMAVDLENYLADAPVSAYADQNWERAARWCRHHRTLTRVMATAASVLAFALILFFSESSRHAEREAQEAAQHSERVRILHENSSQLAADFAARGIGEEINKRWQVLENSAADPALMQLLKDLAKNQTFQPGTRLHDSRIVFNEQSQLKLNQWLDVEKRRSDSTTRSFAWFIYDHDGYMSANASKSATRRDIIGQYFGYRTHFNGGERDLKPEEVALNKHRPMRSHRRSIIYNSNLGHKPRLAFSVPIWDLNAGKDDEPMGVLGMAVDSGDFDFMNISWSPGQIGMLVDIRKDWLGKAGRILQYGNRKDSHLILGHVAQDDEKNYVTPQVLERLNLLHETRMNRDPRPFTNSKHEDRVSTPPKMWPAAYEEVEVRLPMSEAQLQGDEVTATELTRLIVIVQEDPNAAEASPALERAAAGP
ncbi:MAG: serine/threonine protein kinase [Planctomycetaceae bacterium]|nr:serine/threonine protein kinase [Planctomycetaceae bacterium]